MNESGQKILDTRKQTEQPKTPLEQFRKKIASLKEEEEILEKQAHFEFINPKELDERDMQAYEAILNFDLKIGSMDELFKIIQKRKEELEVTGTATQNQKVFLVYLDNLVQGKVEKDLIR